MTASGPIKLPGITRISANGRHGITLLGATGRAFTSATVSILDLQAGTRTPVTLPSPPFDQSFRLPSTDGRIIANDGTAILGITNGNRLGGYLLKPGADPRLFPIDGALPLLISADAAKVLYQNRHARVQSPAPVRSVRLRLRHE